MDLQWIDTPTLDLLEHLLTDPDINHILIIGTISENEVTPSHPLMKSLDSMRNSGTTIQTIVNSPSGEDHRFELNKESPRREEKPLQQFDAAKLVKTIQKVSQQLELPKLMQALTTYALETSTADRGLLIVSHDKINTVEVEASADGNNINVKAVQAPIDSNSCSETIVTYAIQARQQVILNDTSLPGVFSNDLYLQQKSKRSLLCLPLLSPNNPAGVLYLENTQSIGAFTPDRVALLELLAAQAAQAAISLENASLYNDLKESEARYRQIIDTANEGVWIQDDNYVTTYANEHMAQMLGYTADDLIGQKATDFMFEEDKIEHALKMSERRNNKSDVYERRLIHKDGRSVWMLISATPIFKDGQFNGSVAMLTDITERIEVEQHLATSEQLFRTLIENSPDQISRYDLNLRRLYINPALQKLFKVPLDQALNKTSMVSSPLLDPEAYMAVIHKVIETEQECSDEIAFHNQQGEIEWASTRFVPEFNLNGKVATVLVISNVITEKKHAEQQRQEHLNFLQSLDRVNRVLQTEGDFDQVMNMALDEILDIFECDRVHLVYPCNPDAPSWFVPIERTRPDYPATYQLGQKQPMSEHVASTMAQLLDSNQPIKLGADSQYPITDIMRKRLHIRSIMTMALYPIIDQPWQLVMQQCSHDRNWNDQELRLFEEIGHRLSDALNSRLSIRNLRESEERFRLVYENSPVPIWEEDFSAVKSRLDELKEICGDDLESYLIEHPQVIAECAAMVHIININSAVIELHEANSKEELLEGLPKTFLAESYNAFRRELIALANGQTELVFDSAVQTLTGRRIDISLSFSVCPGYEKSLTKVFISTIDITQRKQSEDHMRLAASVFSTSQEGILISDANNRIIDVNPAFSHLTGYSRDEALGKNPKFLSANQNDPALYEEMWQSINSNGEWQGELYNKRKSGEIFPEQLSIVAVRDKHGELQHYVGAFSDISMIKRHEADLDRIAHYDMLTSVANRRLLGDRLEQAIAHAKRHTKNLAVCYLDLDGFKPINDQFGHEAGDRMLIEIARRLETISRAEDTVARLGGDEFVLLWNNIGSQSNCAMALNRVLMKVSSPMQLENQPVSVTASIGVTLYPDDNVDADSLLRHADHAMYTAKQLGKNRYQIFDARLERHISARIELMEKIDHGLDCGQFELYYQPKVDYTTCQVVGVEALLRWNDPVLGLVGPKEFLSLIENDVLAFRMGCWVMKQAVRQAKIWHERGITLPISINVFPCHLKHHSFVDDLRSAIASNWPQMPRSQLMIEIVETDDLEELEPIEQVIRECVAMGIGFSLDDFGTGYSSLVYLRRLSIQELKIDQSFVRDMLEDPDDEAIVVGVISLGRAFGLRVVAEGVETLEQAQYLTNLDCPIVQGNGLGKPMPAHTLEQWYTAFTKELTECHK